MDQTSTAKGPGSSIRTDSGRAGEIVPLSRAALPHDSVALARDLIGRLVVREHPEGRLVGRIVETEAYLPGDAASHAFRGRTLRNASMFRRHGHAYVYLAYGTSMMLNVSSEEEGVGGGVLIRAVEPLEGLALMAKLRGTERVLDLARGPGRLAQAFDIDRGLDGIDLCARGPLWLGRDAHPPLPIRVTTRIGISKDAERPLRFIVAGSPFASGPARLNRG